MRLRIPYKEKPESNIANDTKQWKSFTVELITPMFGGGVSAGTPDEDMPVRAAAIRGQLRYWWRFLNRYKNSSSELFRKEREIWGGASEESKDYSSRVMLRIKPVSLPNIDACAVYEKQKKDKTRYKGLPRPLHGIPSYALFPGRGELEPGGRCIKKEPAKVVLSGYRFELQINILEPDLYEDIELALRWWATFGGLGARTRRGLGKIRLEGMDPVTIEKAREMGCTLLVRELEATTNVADAWKSTIGYLKQFRQGIGVGRTSGVTNEYGTVMPGESRWPEPDSIRTATGNHATKHSDSCNKNRNPSHPAISSFPRAAFGLPIVFKFKDDKCGDPAQTELMPTGDLERLASPLILTPYPLDKGKYAPAALLMPTDHIDNLELALAYSGDHHKEIACYSRDHWWDSSRVADVPPVHENNGTDALTAFMKFFANGGQINE